jgi:hypothetical protein
MATGGLIGIQGGKEHLVEELAESAVYPHILIVVLAECVQPRANSPDQGLAEKQEGPCRVHQGHGALSTVSPVLFADTPSFFQDALLIRVTGHELDGQTEETAAGFPFVLQGLSTGIEYAVPGLGSDILASHFPSRLLDSRLHQKMGLRCWDQALSLLNERLQIGLGKATMTAWRPEKGNVSPIGPVAQRSGMYAQELACFPQT